jgi:hypothetical protein
MKQNRPWTEQELNQIKADFVKGERIKTMAYKLGRSPSSLNKILSRYHIRNPETKDRNQKGYIEWDPSANYCKGKLPPIIEYKSLKPKETSSKNLKKIKRPKKDTAWVSLRDVVDYIKSKGISIEILHLKENTIPSAYNEAAFFLNHKPSSPLKVVLFANKLRLEEGKQTFLTKEVTW